MSIKGLKKDEYDVVIIGAGIGGLVCGCYLAKAGMKVLIVEKNDKPGGYCCSFERGGFRFDVGAHALGGMYEGGPLRKIIHELNLDVEITRINPSDTIITPDYKIYIWNDLRRTIYNFQDSFPMEAKNLDSFFSFILNARITEMLINLREKTFSQFLDQYFKDKKLKTILSLPLGNLGVSSKIASAIASVFLYRQFIFNGGYYPIGGMQSLPTALSNKFREFGGKILFSKLVERIAVSNSTAKGVFIEENGLINSNFVVSNCDIRQTFFKLIENKFLRNDFLDNIQSIVPSPSVFAVYIGLADNLNNCIVPEGCALWYTSVYDIDSSFLNSKDTNKIDYLRKGFFCSLSYVNSGDTQYNKKNIHLLRIVPFKNKKFWEENKHMLAERLIGQLNDLIPNISKYVILKETATPYDFYRYTLNYKGSAYGCAIVLNEKKLSYKIPIKNLFITGHWFYNEFGTGGISPVASVGYSTSQKILKYNLK